MSATVINFERCIAMYFPMRYHSLVTRKTLKAACAIQFILAYAFALTRYNIPARDSGFYCGVEVDISPSLMNRIVVHAYLVGNIVAYILMIWHLKGRRQQNAMIPVSTANKALSKLTFVSSFLILCYTPSFVTSEVGAYLPDAKLLKTVRDSCALLALMNSNLNPVLYVWRFYEVRYQIAKLFCFWNKSKLAQLREKRRHYFATFDISTVGGNMNANFQDP